MKRAALLPESLKSICRAASNAGSLDCSKDLPGLLDFLMENSVASGSRDWRVRSRLDSFFFLPLCIPIVRYGSDRLDSQSTPGCLILLSSQAHRKLRLLLTSRLLSALRPAAKSHFLEFQKTAAIQEGNRRHLGVRPVARFFEPSPAFRTLLLFQRYPGLARLAADLVTDWVESTTELLDRLGRDRQRLIELFGTRPERRTKRAFVVNINGGMGDSHRHGRTVAALTLSCGCRVIYKPRRCRGEKVWEQILGRLKDASLRPRQPKLLLRKNWAWSEFVPARACRTKAEARTFYRRAGSVVCVAYLLRAVDLHRANLIASGPHPVLVDAETLWHPEQDILWRDFQPPWQEVPLTRTGLLPSAGIDGQSEWCAFECLTEDPADHVAHRPRLKGVTLCAARFIGEMKDGFSRAAVELLGSHRKRLALAAQLRAVAARPWRKVLWPTKDYAALCEESLQPCLLESPSQRFAWLIARCAERGVPAEIALQEAEALARLDIPTFTTSPAQGREQELELPGLADILSRSSEISTSLSPF